jgi:uncharacterized iron-regulated membrane protein
LPTRVHVAPTITPALVAFPGTPFTSTRHFAVFLRGDEALTSRLLKPMLLDGKTGDVSHVRDLPRYLRLLFVSQPLHFGDYAGMPLKITCALLDLGTIVVMQRGISLDGATHENSARLALSCY